MSWNMRAALGLAMATFAFVIIIGCSSDKSEDGGTSTPVACGIGQIYVSGYSCRPQCLSQPGYGYIQETNQCLQGVAGTTGTISTGIGGTTGYYGLIWSNRMQITNTGLYRDFLKNFAYICNQVYIGVSFGTASCNSWDYRATVYLELSSSTLPTYGAVTVYAYNDYSYTWGGAGAPVSLTGQFAALGTNQFQLRTSGYSVYNGTGSNVAVTVDGTLNPTPTHLLLHLSYAGQEFGYADVRQGYTSY